MFDRVMPGSGETSVSEVVARRALSLLRSFREYCYRLVTPVDSTFRRLRRAPPLPPLWLRRHIGPVHNFSSAAASTLGSLKAFNMVRPGITVLDLGCGCGSMALALLPELGSAGRYDGIDVHAASIAWCQRRFAGDERFRFTVAEIESPYSSGRRGGPRQRLRPAVDYSFPVPDASVDTLIAKSLFTHLLPDVTERYLREIRRTLKPDGLAFVTFFLCDEIPTPAFPYPRPPAQFRWRRRYHPHAAVAYERSTIERLLAACGLTVEVFVEGFYPGRLRRLEAQDQLIVRRTRSTARSALSQRGSAGAIRSRVIGSGLVAGQPSEAGSL